MTEKPVVKCDGNHGGPRCADPECWNDSPADAQPGVPMTWYAGEPPFPQNQEWFIAETIHGGRVVLRPLPKEHSYDYTTADYTYMIAGNIKRWMQFPDSEFVAPQPPTSDQTADIATALEQQRALAIVAAVRKQGYGKSHADIPTQAESVFDLACEEIETRLRTEQWSLGSVDVPLPAPTSAKPAASAEPLAWMHDEPGRVDVIHAAVKKLLHDSHEAAGYLHRPLDKSERYTIPLYAAPVAAQPSVPSRSVTAEKLRDLAEKWRMESVDYPETHAGVYASSAVRCCADELLKLLDQTLGTGTPGGQL